MRRWLPVAAVLLASVLLVHAVPSTLAATARPNVLLILADDLGYGDLGCYGAPDLRSPNIDALAAAGMKFDRFYANSPVCSPTRASLLTGRYPDFVGVPGVIRTRARDNWGHLAREAVLIGEVLGRAGYATAMVGKWHLGLEAPNTPTGRGFKFFKGFLGDMMEDYYHHRRHGINYMRDGTTEIDPKGHATDLFTRWACDYVRSRKGQSGPFFLYLAYNAPHTPIQPPPAWVEKVTGRRPGIDKARARLVALIEHMDAGIGKVLETLRATGLAEDTLVIFASDNGGHSEVGANNGPLRAGKQTMYEGGIRVPAIAVWPGKIAPGSRSARVAATMDVFPTLCAAAGAKFDHAIDGVSFLPTLLGEKQPEADRDLFFSRREGGARYGGKTIHAVRRGPWKLVHDSPWGPLELYNLDNDPTESRDLSKSEPKRFESLSAALRKYIQRSGAVPWQKPISARE